jgi:hypothetical protein
MLFTKCAVAEALHRNENIISSSTMAPFQFEYIKIEDFDSVGFEAFTIYLKYKRLIIDK